MSKSNNLRNISQNQAQKDISWAAKELGLIPPDRARLVTFMLDHNLALLEEAETAENFAELKVDSELPEGAPLREYLSEVWRVAAAAAFQEISESSL